MSQLSAEHHLIFNAVKSCLNHVDISNQAKNAIAMQAAIVLRDLVRVKERDE